jgi:hypothetical protein
VDGLTDHIVAFSLNGLAGAVADTDRRRRMDGEA